MIKNSPDADAEITSKEQKEAEESESIAAFVRENTFPEMPQNKEKMPLDETVEAFKIPDNARFFKKEDENLPVVEENLTAMTVEKTLASEQAEIVTTTEEKTFPKQTSTAEENFPQSFPTEANIGRVSAENEPENYPPGMKAVPMQTQYNPPSMAETIRRSGLAWSAGIVLFGSVVFMLIVGWFVDLILGSSPIGIVVGIVFGSVIGFVQLFRITSQIFKNGK